jgi:hypothetical protein
MPYRQPGAGIRLFAFLINAELCVTLAERRVGEVVGGTGRDVG